MEGITTVDLKYNTRRQKDRVCKMVLRHDGEVRCKYIAEALMQNNSK